MSGFSYLASPYTHHSSLVREARFIAVCKAAAELMRSGKVIFSPIAHSHPIDLHFDAPESGDFWKNQDVHILRHASELIVLKLDGWSESAGIRWEIEMAQALSIPVTYMEPVHT
jgi:hypothetical protein